MQLKSMKPLGTASYVVAMLILLLIMVGLYQLGQSEIERGEETSDEFQELLDWPTVTGYVDTNLQYPYEANITSTFGQIRSTYLTTLTGAEFSYTYMVDEIEYQSDTISPCAITYGQFVEEVPNYPLLSNVTVYYNPEFHEESYLQITDLECAETIQNQGQVIIFLGVGIPLVIMIYLSYRQLLGKE